jgi:hypothetical protein
VTARGKAIPEHAPSDPNGPRGTGEPGRLCPVAGDGSGFYRLQVGKGGVEGVRGRVWFSPGDVYELEFHRLQGETEAEDDVVRARDPDRAAGLADAARLFQPPDVELVILRKPYRPNRVTTLLALQGTLGERWH